jgi:tRNA-2-methylthio-N6-dimethylallyladenosine synthase
VVPYTRGAEISRPFAELIDEAKALVDAGAKEITLLGQNVNAWEADGQDLGSLIRALDRIDGLARIRYMTSHPNDMSDGLIAAHGDVEKLMPFLHLPVQSGSDRILKAMNRSHTRDSYLRIIERVRAVRPDVALSGDFIVGFPGESDADFDNTLSIIRDAGYAMAYSFKYSPRPGTPAATMDNQITDEVADERLQRLQTLLVDQQTAFNATTLGKTTDILLERQGKLPGQLIGKSPWLQSVHIVAPGLNIGDIVTVDITETGPMSLKGEIRMKAAA